MQTASLSLPKSVADFICPALRSACALSDLPVIDKLDDALDRTWEIGNERTSALKSQAM